MHLFKKSNKNKTTSAPATPAQTPAQTPRASMDESCPIDTTTKQKKHVQDAEMLHKLMSKAMVGGYNGPYIL